MPVTVVDLTPSFLDFWRQAASEPRAQQRERWAALLETPAWRTELPALKRHFAHADLDAALDRYPAALAAIQYAPGVVTAAADPIVNQLRETFALPDFAPRFVILVSLFMSDGWLDSRDGVATVYVAVDALERVEQVPMLLAHELAHAAHSALEPDHLRGFTTLGHALVVEGIALATTATLFPEASIGANCWANRERTVTGQPVEAWAAECARVWESLRRGLHTHFDSTTDEDYARYFFGIGADASPPIRSGYYAAQRLMTTVLKDRQLADILRAPIDDARDAVRTALGRD